MHKQIAFAAFEQYWAAKSLQMYMEEVYLKEPKNQSWWATMFSRRRVSVLLLSSDGGQLLEAALEV